jgi:hypothetical protein
MSCCLFHAAQLHFISYLRNHLNIIRPTFAPFRSFSPVPAFYSTIARKMKKKGEDTTVEELQPVPEPEPSTESVPSTQSTIQRPKTSCGTQFLSHFLSE